MLLEFCTITMTPCSPFIDHSVVIPVGILVLRFCSVLLLLILFVPLPRLLIRYGIVIVVRYYSHTIVDDVEITVVHCSGFSADLPVGEGTLLLLNC